MGNHPSKMSSAGYSVSKSGSARSKGRASSNASSKEASISNNTESDKTTHSSSPSVKRFMVWYREVKGRRANSLKTFNNSDYVTVSDYGSSSEAHSVTSERGFARSENTIWIDGRERMVLDMNGHIAAVPSDSEDAEQSKTNHYVLRYVLRGNHVAALQNPKRILEVGTRTGLWTKEMAKEFPKAKITAIDIHDDVERDNWPSNAEFLLCDILSPNGLPFKDGHFDYVQMRTMRYFLPDETWPKVVSELYRVCKPGGLVELLEADFNFQTQTPETKRLMNTYAAVLRTSGVELEAIQHLDLLLELTGFTEIQRQLFNVPAGDWGETIGRIVGRTSEYYFKSFRAQVAQFELMDLSEYDEVLDYCSNSLDELRAHLTIYVNVGRKPLAKTGRANTIAAPCAGSKLMP